MLLDIFLPLYQRDGLRYFANFWENCAGCGSRHDPADCVECGSIFQDRANTFVDSKELLDVSAIRSRVEADYRE
jgi:hypothetical protein